MNQLALRECRARAPARKRLGRTIKRALGGMCSALCIFDVVSTAARAELPSYNPRTTFGEIGLLEMPSARMAPDGQLAITIGVLNHTQRYNGSFQILPWLEGSFRYSHVGNLFNNPHYYDRSFGLKIRLLHESAYIPEVSLGMRDILGTGVYSGEYIVASKEIGDVDVTAGLGWGRLAQSGTFANPLGLIFPSFKTRSSNVGQGGTISYGQLFHGPKVGIFGGVLWRTPIENLDVIAEYSSDRYFDERSFDAFTVRVPINVGLSYNFRDYGTLTAGWYYASTLGVTFSLSADPTVATSPQRLGPEIPQPVIRPANKQIEALTLLLSRNKPETALARSVPWVQLPVSMPDPDSLALSSALMSETAGVHDIDIMNRTLLIDATLANSAKDQCNRYAQIVASLDPKLKTIAISDLSDHSGRVEVCAIATRNLRLAADTADHPAADQSDNADSIPSATTLSGAGQKIRADISAQSIRVEALAIEPEMVWLYFANGHYRSESEAAGRIARVLMADAPPSVEIFHIVSVRNGIALRDFQIARSALERATANYGTPDEMGDAVSLRSPPLSNPVLERAWADSYPRIHWNIGPGVREGFFDPDRPLEVQVFGALDASLEVTHALTFEFRAEGNIFNNFNFKRLSDSLLPHVRSDALEYSLHGSNGIAKFDALYRTRITRDLYLELKAGYLESMFAGAGAQLLWRPEGDRFTFGADLYEVWQRKFDRLYGLQSYHVLTGHASVYYESPWYGLDFAVHAGRFLAGDYGATVEITRRFSTGIEVGAFATFTNVPFAKFGEGSFDKGIIIHIPLEWSLPFYTQTSYDLLLRSLQRDGGQRLDDDDSLYGETRPTSYGEVLEHDDEIIAP